MGALSLEKLLGEALHAAVEATTEAVCEAGEKFMMQESQHHEGGSLPKAAANVVLQAQEDVSRVRRSRRVRFDSVVCGLHRRVEEQEVGLTVGAAISGMVV